MECHYLNATQALGGSDGSHLTMISEEDQVFTMSFHVTKNCTDKWFLDTIHFSTSGSNKVVLKTVLLVIELQVTAKWGRKVLVLYPIILSIHFFSNLNCFVFVFYISFSISLVVNSWLRLILSHLHVFLGDCPLKRRTKARRQKWEDKSAKRR